MHNPEREMPTSRIGNLDRATWRHMSMKYTRLAFVLLAMALVAGACGSASDTTSTQPSATSQPATPPNDPGSSSDGFVPGEVVRLDLARTAATVTESDIAAVVAADAAFGMDLFRTTAGDTNLMVSPYSIAAALSMLYPGAKGATAAEIADVLHLSVDEATLHAVRNHIDTALATTPPPMGDNDTRAPFTVRPANSAWGQGGYPFLEPYLQILAENYGAGLRLLDYAGDPDGSLEIINDWVEDATEERIKDLIPEGAITVDTRLALVNAIWFKANWFEPFDQSATTLGPFQLLDGTDVETPFMHANRKMDYASTESFDAVRLRYAGDAAMVVLVPKSGSPAELATALGSDVLDIAWAEHQVTLTMPSFEFETELGLKSALQGLGMRAAFEQPSNDGADLTGITAVRELYVSDAFHKTFVALDEEGTEAAAATAIIVALESAAAPAVLKADRPFLFWIEHTSTGEMLFLGQVTNPAG